MLRPHTTAPSAVASTPENRHKPQPRPLSAITTGSGSSTVIYKAIAGVNWQFAERYTAKLGYRHMYWYYKDGGTVWT